MGTHKISLVSPIRFHNAATDDFFYNKIPAWEYSKGYCQKYRHGDRPYIQVVSSTVATCTMSLITNEGTVIGSWPVGDSGRTYRGDRVYHWINYFPLGGSDGIYFLKLVISDSHGSLTMYSEPIELSSDSPDTVAIRYSHDENDFDRVFVGSNVMQSLLRIEAGVKTDGFAPGGKFTMFADLNYNSVILQSQPYNVEKWTFGPSEGIPNYMADIINRIFGLSTVEIDGVQYSRNEGAKIERSGVNEYPLAGWSLDLIKSENPYSYEASTTLAALTVDTTQITVDSTLITSDQTTL